MLAVADLDLTFPDLLIVSWVAAQMARLPQGEVEVGAAVSVVEPESTKTSGKSAVRPKIDRQHSGRQRGKDSRTSNEREERRVVSRMTGRRTEVLCISPPSPPHDAPHDSAQFFFFLSWILLLVHASARVQGESEHQSKTFLLNSTPSKSLNSYYQYSEAKINSEGHWNNGDSHQIPPQYLFNTNHFSWCQTPTIQTPTIHPKESAVRPRLYKFTSGVMRVGGVSWKYDTTPPLVKNAAVIIIFLIYMYIYLSDTKSVIEKHCASDWFLLEHNLPDFAFVCAVFYCETLTEWIHFNTVQFGHQTIRKISPQIWN